jgi:hypothetical protein
VHGLDHCRKAVIDLGRKAREEACRASRRKPIDRPEYIAPVVGGVTPRRDGDYAAAAKLESRAPERDIRAE